MSKNIDRAYGLYAKHVFFVSETKHLFFNLRISDLKNEPDWSSNFPYWSDAMTPGPEIIITPPMFPNPIIGLHMNVGVVLVTAIEFFWLKLPKNAHGCHPKRHHADGSWLRAGIKTVGNIKISSWRA